MSDERCTRKSARGRACGYPAGHRGRHEWESVAPGEPLTNEAILDTIPSDEEQLARIIEAFSNLKDAMDRAAGATRREEDVE